MAAAAASGAASGAATAAAGEAGAPQKGKRKLLLLAAPAALAAITAGLWFSGVLPALLGHGKKAPAAEVHPADQPVTPVAVKPPTFVDLPEIIANLNGGRHAAYVKLHARLELGKPEDQAAVTAAMPRLLDLFQTYLREMRPEELRGSAGTWRLREELIARANIAATPARIVDVLFTEMLIQ
jgi:flagellar FliL protein